jgi:hypothetical protein
MGDWWSNQQVCTLSCSFRHVTFTRTLRWHYLNSKPVGSTIIRIFRSSDQTNVLNYSRTINKWAPDLHFGNIMLSERCKPMKKCCMMILFFPVPLNHALKVVSKP